MQICCRHCCLAFNIFVDAVQRVKLVYSAYMYHVIDEWDYTAMDIKPHFHVKSLMCLSINHTHKACISTHIQIQNTHYTNSPIHPQTHTHSILCGRLCLLHPPLPRSPSLSFSWASSYPVILVKFEKKDQQTRLKYYPYAIRLYSK